MKIHAPVLKELKQLFKEVPYQAMADEGIDNPDKKITTMTISRAMKFGRCNERTYELLLDFCRRKRREQNQKVKRDLEFITEIE